MTLATTALDWADWIAFALWAGWWLATMLGVYCLGIVHGLRKAPTVTINTINTIEREGR